MLVKVNVISVAHVTRIEVAIQLTQVWGIFQGLDPERVDKFLSFIQKKSHLRPSVMFHALTQTKQQHVVEEIRTYWEYVIHDFL